MNARNQNNFNDSMKLGDKAEKELMTILQQSITGFISVDKVDWTKFGFDLAVTYERENIQFTKAVGSRTLLVVILLV